MQEWNDHITFSVRQEGHRQSIEQTFSTANSTQSLTATIEPSRITMDNFLLFFMVQTAYPNVTINTNVWHLFFLLNSALFGNFKIDDADRKCLLVRCGVPVVSFQNGGGLLRVLLKSSHGFFIPEKLR